MKRLFLIFVLCSLSIFSSYSAGPITSSQNQSQEEKGDIIAFTPPSGWGMTSEKLPPSVKVMVLGKGNHPFPPSMNLATEPYKMALKQYLKTIKAMNDAQGYEWKDLGTIQTEAGPASLSQVDTKTEWGNVRQMHTILLKNGHIYILSASALKEEFPKFYKDFFTAMRSLRISKDIFEMIPSPQRKTEFKTATRKLEEQWKNLLVKQKKENPDESFENVKVRVFEGEDFQNTLWIPYKGLVEQNFSEMGPDWQTYAIQKIEKDLFEFNL